MLVLALDSALEACAAAIVETDGKEARALAAETLAMNRGQAEALLPMVARVMRAADLRFSDLDRIAVTVGPGSFTGLRVGLAAARGLALASGRPAFGVTTLSALAASAFAGDGEPVAAALDVRRGEVCMQAFAAPGEALDAPALVDLADIPRRLPPGRVRLAGSAASAVAALDPARLTVSGAEAAPDILWVARLGARTGHEASPPRAFYLRPPDAKPQDSARISRAAP